MTTAPVPRASRRLLDRPRLVDRLRRRHAVRLTLITGGAGSGKTSLLTQALDEPGENNLDLWHVCSGADGDADHLLDRVTRLAAASADVDPATPDVPLAELILRLAPRRCCIVLDDAHELPDGNGVRRLLDLLPANGHLVLAGRSLPTIETARHGLSGELEVITQEDLLLTVEEVKAFAALRGVDADVLAEAGGWPAFVELAATGGTRSSERFLREEAVAHLDSHRRQALARFAFVGGGDDDLCRAVTGLGVDELVADLPLVRFDGDQTRLHDLWAELLVDELDESARGEATARAIERLRHIGDVDRAVELGVRTRRWDEVLDVIGDACRGGVTGGYRATQLHRWRRAVPLERSDHPVVVLIDGLLAREADLTADHTLDLFRRAAAGFAERDDPELERAALAQLGYCLRTRSDATGLAELRARFEELGRRDRISLAFVHIIDAWTALVHHRPAEQLAALVRIDEVDLPEDWRATVLHLRAHALMNLGRPEEALEHVPDDIIERTVQIPGALVTWVQCHWHAGRPELALAEGAAGIDRAFGARDRFIAGAWYAVMAAYAGRVEEARQALVVARSHVGDRPSPLVEAQSAALELVIRIHDGDEEDLGRRVQAIQREAGEAVATQLWEAFVWLPYLCDPASRPMWDARIMPPSYAVGRDLTRALVAAREDDDLGPLRALRWPRPGPVAASLACPYAVELSLWGELAGRGEGRTTLEWLTEHWGAPAADAIRRHRSDPRLAEVATRALAEVPRPPQRHPQISVLGPPGLAHDGVPTIDAGWRRSRVQMLLGYLVLHPVATRDRVAAALWPDLDPQSARRNVRTTLNYLNTVLEPEREANEATWCLRADGERLTLRGDVEVDLWRFRDDLAAAHVAEADGRTSEALRYLLDAIGRWRGPLLDGIDEPWLDLERIDVTSAFARGSARAAVLLTASGRPDEAIPVARAALAADEWNPELYAALADAYEAVGDDRAANAVRDLWRRRMG